ncbi:MAG: TauD/TfdA family dioxygenase [Hyphomicrobiales bacterium]|nr:TauD/TfdA family dioxygenase [Hyphomicrobiales bacterium]
MSFEVVKLHPLIGAEIKGIDLSKPVDEATRTAINKALDDNIVIVFRGQTLDEAQQLKAAEILGKVALRRRPVSGPGPGGEFDTPFMMVTNIVKDGKPIGSFGDGEMWFHHDTSYYPEPHRATLLYAMELTSTGGETRFSNMYEAYNRIPGELRDKLEGRRVLQIHDYKRRERLDLDAIDIAKVRHKEQPVFITHPNTGRKALYISRLMSARIEGLTREESESALNRLFDISEDPEIIYEHHWQLGDLVVWDNWCSIHARNDFPRDEPRLMRRLTIEGQEMVF